MAERFFACVLLAVSLFSDPSAPREQVLDRLDRGAVAEAVRLAAEDTEAAKLLSAYTVQPRGGWGDGPVIGLFSTPFSRVVHAALAARRKQTLFGVDQVPAELLVPELHVLATAQRAWPDGSLMATVQSVVLVANDGAGLLKVVEAVRTRELTPQDRELYRMASTDPGIVAIFPASALTPGTAIRVTFDRTARGFSGSSMCRECVAFINLRRVR